MTGNATWTDHSTSFRPLPLLQYEDEHQSCSVLLAK